MAIGAIVEHLNVPHDDGTPLALTEAIKSGYLKPNPGKQLHTVSVTHKWRYERAVERERK